ncbi:PA3496 family putative envelope integrity protein [Stutzerimonas azotifigens]|uniref:PA3496 family putative envelope integrity protein n=1 Tax=Stutzerimonas azotifigens TaxID=291995 RepID=UPI0004291FA6|nr:hypothetical protein [Stutzerimonas azotifigens]
MSWQPDDLHALDAKTRRQLKDQRRMRFRRAIESYGEQRRLQAELDDYPDLIAARQLAASAQTLPFSQREKVA